MVESKGLECDRGTIGLLHNGARRYLERDEPDFLERYAETMNFLVYLVFLILTGLVGLARWRSQRKKDRIDVFYQRTLVIRNKATPEICAQLLIDLGVLEEEAFQSLIDEKLAADESFSIFTDLVDRVRSDLSRREGNG